MDYQATSFFLFFFFTIKPHLFWGIQDYLNIDYQTTNEENYPSIRYRIQKPDDQNTDIGKKNIGCLALSFLSFLSSRPSPRFLYCAGKNLYR
jgi:hypothetical protein